MIRVRSRNSFEQPNKIFAGVEGGGTTWRVALAVNVPDNIVEEAEFPTTTPAETLSAIVQWLSERQYDAIGIGTFGPVDLDKNSPTYGYITTTPKPGWQNTDVLTPLLSVRPDVPYQFDTDCNAPAMAEFTLGGIRGEGLHSCAYITVGTGVGVGLVVNGECVHGLLHPEGGMVPVPLLPGYDEFSKESTHPMPRSTESMVGSAAIARRAGCGKHQLKELPEDHPVWDEVAYYLAGLCVNLILIVSPEKIVFGGGVLLRGCLLPKIRKQVRQQLNGYVANDKILTSKIDDYIVNSIWGNTIGIIGSLALAQVALLEQQQATVTGVSVPQPLSREKDSMTYGYIINESDHTITLVNKKDQAQDDKQLVVESSGTPPATAAPIDGAAAVNGHVALALAAIAVIAGFALGRTMR